MDMEELGKSFPEIEVNIRDEIVKMVGIFFKNEHLIAAVYQVSGRYAGYYVEEPGDPKTMIKHIEEVLSRVEIVSKSTSITKQEMQMYYYRCILTEYITSFLRFSKDQEELLPRAAMLLFNIQNIEKKFYAKSKKSWWAWGVLDVETLPNSGQSMKCRHLLQKELGKLSSN
jgi:hypothetical protein